jgi:hypothetical protein
VSALPKRALTLWQPWAFLVATGIKNIENRPPGFSHKSFRGDFWIHAAAESSASIGSWPLAAKLCRELLGDDFQIPPARELAFGSIIGRATITGIVPPRGSQNLEIWDAWIAGRPVPWHFPEQYGFRVENARALATPVPCRGFQGFWNVPAATLAALSEAP